MTSHKNTPGNANLPIGAFPSDNPPLTGHNPAPAWRSRGYLPHFESSELTQHVTFHLADSLPQSTLARLESALKTIPIDRRGIELRKRVDAWMDAGHGSCALGTPAVAAMVQGSLLTFDSERYHLLAWVVMPNHFHVLFQPITGWTVAKIVAAWKKFAARKIHDAANREIGVPGKTQAPHHATVQVTPVWHREYWDRYIRDEAHLMQVIDYIHMNPVKAALVATPDSWPWSSAYSGNAILPIGALTVLKDFEARVLRLPNASSGPSLVNRGPQARASSVRLGRFLSVYRNLRELAVLIPLTLYDYPRESKTHRAQRFGRISWKSCYGFGLRTCLAKPSIRNAPDFPMEILNTPRILN
jgi:REP element-mobilizing transposase RayT